MIFNEEDIKTVSKAVWDMVKYSGDLLLNTGKARSVTLIEGRQYICNSVISGRGETVKRLKEVVPRPDFEDDTFEISEIKEALVQGRGDYWRERNWRSMVVKVKGVEYAVTGVEIGIKQDPDEKIYGQVSLF